MPSAIDKRADVTGLIVAARQATSSFFSLFGVNPMLPA
jgi:hypothetical protein